ncbi:hypothetical protein HLH17_03100 [Acinetobacter sp. ANC 5380]|uniref:Lipoprotein n=1 Tax=Acinetobacter terrae TaxID=2731247 RepID=A0A7Y2WAH5_9GAMM|nr:hypothetical protein [Acinetobacter terrae]NNH76683.1 hypothetical protein [Acinetobacter terrae]
MLTKISKIHVFTIAISSFLTACGDGSDNTESSNFTPTPINGTAVDFYLKNADIKFDDCENKFIKTDTKGNFSFTTTAACNESALTITGGIDIGTNLPFTGTLKFKKMDLKNLKNGTLVVSPLTSLEYYLEKAGQSGQLDKILTNLGLSNINNISQFDPAKDGDAHTMAVVFIFQQLATQIEDRLQTINKSDGSTAFTQEQAAQITFDTLISQLSTQPLFATNSAKIDSAVLKNIINKAIDNAKAKMNDSNIIIDTTFTDQISSNIIAVSTAIANIAQNGGTSANLLSELQKNPDVLETITENLKSPIYNDLFLANYDIAAIKASSATNPLNINFANLNNTLAVQFKLANTKSELNDTVALAFKLEGSKGSYRENLNVSINNIQVKFNNQGSIISAKIPKNTIINISSSFKNIQQFQFSVPQDLVINSNGNISVNYLIQSHGALKYYYNNYINKLPTGSLIQVTAYILPSTYTINPQLNLAQETVTIGTSTFKSSALTGYFKLN